MPSCFVQTLETFRFLLRTWWLTDLYLDYLLALKAYGSSPTGAVPRPKTNPDELYKYNKKDCMNADTERGWFLPKKESQKFNKSTNFFTHEEIKASKDLKKIVEKHAGTGMRKTIKARGRIIMMLLGTPRRNRLCQHRSIQ